MVNISDFFKDKPAKAGSKRKANTADIEARASAKRSKSAKPKRVMIDVDKDEDDGDDDFQFDDEEIIEIEKPKKRKEPSLSPQKTTSKYESKQSDSITSSPKRSKKTTDSSKTQRSSDVKTAAEILATVPDAELPEIDENEKINFMALKAQQKSTVVSEPIDLPQAQPDCLSGLTIVFTGQMPSLDRTTAEQIAQQYGAKVTKSISGKTSLVVIGADAGPSKVKKIKQLKIKAIDEDGFLQLLSKMPADGGSGEAAQKAKLAREAEEKKILEDAKREQQREKEEEEAAAAAAVSFSQVNINGTGSQTRLPPIPKQEISAKNKLWTDKHAPKDFSQLCGNKGQVEKLRKWLGSWFDNKARGFKNSRTDDPGNFRAVLISGPPGIGKTTAAHMVANSLGFDVLEKNASDVRSKSLLNANVKSVLNNTSVAGYFKHRNDADAEKNENTRKICLIMDEVDGMSSGDHGGAGALSQFCRTTNTPMILICNDKSLPKMRTFDRVTFDLPFKRPSENEVKSRLMTIALREGIKLDPHIIGQLVQLTSNDIRQMINLLSTVSKTQKDIGANNVQEIRAGWKKQVILKPFDIAHRLLGSAIWTSPKQNINEKLDLYFNDIDFAPLMIQENYLCTKPRLPGSHLKHVAQAADDISVSDSINSLIRSSEQQWSLLPFHGIMSSVKPSYEVAGAVMGRLNFSSWLGQNSKQLKFQRILQELQYHTRIKTSTTKQELRLDYLRPLWEKLDAPLKKRGDDGIDETIEIMDEYYLTKEDLDNMSEMLKQTICLGVKSKSMFTRKYNSVAHPTVIYKTGDSLATGGKRSATKVDYEEVVDDDMEDVPDDNEDETSDSIDIKKDKLIKEKTSKKKPEARSKSTKTAAPKKRAKK
ncbi:rfc1 [Candida oxycetoniae]|uniref:Replication factor C subunit 1 n=1 Tax=Candida oxycetoniae TaxID=497107 RepID=A0AAI9T004_9ASCO|nr:rfc1 [Candida oxycetoniae]KAI3405701.2 rfc1 [Candida oxycetoniae]